jgi:immunity protein 5 of polymorphic toxin system
MTLTTTLQQLKEHNACESGLETLAQSLPNHSDTTPIPLSHILESNGLGHAIWALRTQDKKYAVMFAVECAERVLHIFEREFPTDDRPRKALEATRNWLADPADGNKRNAAETAAKDAARASWVARAAEAAEAAEAAWAAAKAADAAARADVVAWSANAAVWAAEIQEKEREAQKEIYLRIVS